MVAQQPNGKDIAKAIVEQIVEAQAWVERYPIDKTVGDIPLQAWKESFELETEIGRAHV